MYLQTVLSNDTKQYREEYAEIFNAHKTIGYPRLTHQEQFEILDKEDLTPVSKLTKFDFVPTGLLNEYLDIEPNQYFEHLKTLNLIDTMRFDSKNLRDGFFINQTRNGYQYIFVDRQQIVFRKNFSSYDRLLKYLVYDRLSLLAPRKYRFAWIKKYFA